MYSVKGSYVVKKPTKPKRTNNKKTIIFDDVILHKDMSYRICQGADGVYAEIMHKIIEQFEIAQANWKRVFVLRFDLHIDHYTETNEIVRRFFNRFNKRLKRKYGFKDVGYCWVREQERAKSQHYHCVFFLDGDLIQNSTKIIPMIKGAWQRTAGYSVPTIKNPFYYVDNEEAAQDAIYRVSYLAKTRGKGYRPPQTKDFNCSRMKLKERN